MTSVFGLAIQTRDTPTTPGLQVAVTSISIGVILRSLTVRLYKLLNGAYVPLAGFPVLITLNDVLDSFSLVTDATGMTYCEFSDINYSLILAALANHTAVLSQDFKAGLKNEQVITFIPNSILRTYPTGQVF